MSRLDVIRRELEAYLAELDAERERVVAFLNGAAPVLATVPDPTGSAVKNSATSRPARADKPAQGGDTAYALSLMTARTDIEEWDTPQLLSVLQENGWTTNAANLPNAVSAILSRLSRAGQVERRSRGRYAVPRPTNAESPAVAGLSVPLAPAREEGGGADGTDTHRVRDDHSSWQAEHRDHGLGAPVVGA